MAGYIINSRIVEVTTPPTIGAAILFITSAPAPWLNMMGIRPARMTLTVIILGRIPLTAPCRIESCEGNDAHPDGDTHIVIQQVEEPEGADKGKRHRKKHDHGLERRFGVE